MEPVGGSENVVLKRLALAALLLLAALPAMTPAVAHRDKPHAPAAAATGSAPTGPVGVRGASVAPGATVMPAGHEMDAMVDEMMKDRAAMSPLERLLDWLGRLHPIIVHFPLAFFPAALFTAVVGRRRPAFAKPVQFLVVAGGIIAPIAMVLGWFDGGLTLSDRDPLLQVHRWLGTVIGFSGLALAIWAARRPDEDRGPVMMLALTVITAAIIVQGWFGGALVHGMDHMNW